MQDIEQVDVLIVGGGLVGASLAAALQGTPWRVALVEASGGTQTPPGFDERNLALAEASLNALRSLDVLPRLARAAEPIRSIHVSREGDFGAIRLQASDYGISAFGGVVMARDLGAALEARLRQLSALRRYTPAEMTACQADSDGWTVTLQQAGQSTRLHCRLLVGADGSGSGVRDVLGIGCDQHDYRQTLFVCSVRCERGVDGSAWERFSDSGPVALLPRNDGRMGAVCGVASEQADAIAALDDGGYRDYLQQRFGYRCGRFLEVGRRSRYPIRRIVAQALTGPRAVLLGNAAQTIHPVGAQGFNLGLRDALHLAEVLSSASDPGAAAALADYAERRRDDRAQTLAFSDGLARFTASPGALAHTLRSLGLLAMDRSRSLRAPLVAGAMGYRGRVPLLARAG